MHIYDTSTREFKILHNRLENTFNTVKNYKERFKHLPKLVVKNSRLWKEIEKSFNR